MPIENAISEGRQLRLLLMAFLFLLIMLSFCQIAFYLVAMATSLSESSLSPSSKVSLFMRAAR